MKVTTEPHDGKDGNIFDNGTPVRIVIENPNAYKGHTLIIRIPVEDVDQYSKTGARASWFEMSEDDGSSVKLKRNGDNWELVH